jgi:5-formyltetrahydrofolate cyclo-ligase
MPNSSPQKDKPELRAAALARREALSVAQREVAAQRLAARALPFDIAPGMIVAGYVPMRSEIDPRPLLQKFAARGARLALPAIVTRDAPLIFRSWRIDDELERGPFGTLQPADSAAPLQPDIVLVPLAAFDRRGHRIGYGGGYYDRTLQKLRAAATIVAAGVAFAMQEVETIPASPHDALLDIVLTDIETIDLRS